MGEAWKTDGEKQMHDDLLRLAKEDGCVAAGFAVEKIEKLEAKNEKQREALKAARRFVFAEASKIETTLTRPFVTHAREALRKIDKVMQ